jgi:hypothetical protein
MIDTRKWTVKFSQWVFVRRKWFSRNALRQCRDADEGPDSAREPAQSFKSEPSTPENVHRLNRSLPNGSIDQRFGLALRNYCRLSNAFHEHRD